ncbi:hypothetical protein ACWDFR_14965 [Streptomyces sp. 900105755]
MRRSRAPHFGSQARQDSRATWENGRIPAPGTGGDLDREDVNPPEGVRYFTERWYARYRTGR